jgi:3'(2'), 5'-bisphosphate nucleotidase
METLDYCFEKASGLAKQAGEAALFYYHSEYEITDKGDNSPVTQADHASNDVIVEGLKKEFDYGILSEETDDDPARLDKKRVWVVDPLDGTKDFIDKTGDFSIMIGLVEKGTPVLGIVYRPEKDIMYYALIDRGAFKKEGKGRPQRARTSSRNYFEDMILLTSRFHASNTTTKAANELGIENTLTKGSAGLKICSIAEGKADVNINPSNKTWEWDICAADIILSEAGGKLTDVFENEFTYNKEDPRNSQGYIASNGWRHYDIIREVRRNYEC